MSMTVHVGVQSKIIPTKTGQQTKYYPVVKSTGRISLMALAEKISLMSSLSTADVIGTIEALTTVIPDEIAMGNIIDLGSFGSFTLTVRARGVDSPDEVSTKQIDKAVLSFRPGPRLKQVLKNIKFRRKK